MQNLPKIVFDIVPHKKQRYNTSGDYFKKGGVVNIRVSKMHPDHEFLILVHELIEWYLTERKGVTIEAIDRFDMMFERAREKGNEEEPGDDMNSPYYEEHQYASRIERLIAEKLGVDWTKYDKHVKSL